MKNKKLGRPKGQTNAQKIQNKSALGFLVQSRRIELGLGLQEVAKRCDCSLQFVSNIEHGRANLPWKRLARFAKVLEVSLMSLEAANLQGKSDFKSALKTSPELIEILRRFQTSDAKTQKKFLKMAKQLWAP